MHIGRGTVLLLSVALSGCSFLPGPMPIEPVESIPQGFSEADATGEYLPMEWWTAYQDPILDRLVDTVLVGD